MSAFLIAMLLFMQARVTESPVTWTKNAKQYETFVEAPKAQDCGFWDASTVGDKCVGFLVFDSNPKKLTCKSDGKFSHVMVCVWDRPVQR